MSEARNKDKFSNRHNNYGGHWTDEITEERGLLFLGQQFQNSESRKVS